MPVGYSEYKGHKLIVLKSDEESRYPFSFGKKKAKLIVENFEAIKVFAEEKEAPKPAVEESRMEEAVKED